MIVLGSGSDLPITADGTAALREMGIPFALRICSAHRTPEQLHQLIREFEGQGGSIYICVAGMSAHLAGVVASATLKPVLAVPVARAETAGLDALLSMGQMPAGIPVSTMGLGKHGFTNAALTAAQILALSDETLAGKLAASRAAQARKVMGDDEKLKQEYRG
jgi:phosphoribosylaminoimidazole carboxylase PurE protein